MNKEQRFYNALEDIFVGAKIEGDSGFINLLKIKERYYSEILAQFKKEVDGCPEIEGNFKEEFFDKLYTFFNKYFSESGSVYFTKTANWQRVYEKVYTDNEDVVLFWKTHMLYYVKTDILFNSIDVNIEDKENNKEYNFYFDVGNLQSKQNNEKRKIIYEFKEIENRNSKDEKGNMETKEVYVFDVMYSERGRITKIDEIVKETVIPDTILQKAFKTFEKQSEVDFFINKNAKEFLMEQLDLYLHQILLEDENKFEQKRLNQIKTIKVFSTKIIDFISQFEDELVRIWNKPKFALNGNYVITLDKIMEETIDKIETHTNLNKQIDEWIELGIVDDEFNFSNREERHRYLPIDTKYFKDLEVEILYAFNNIDEALDGRLIHSENYQALNTLQNKYNGKIQCIYIDPPFNTGNDFDYVDKFQNSTWLTLMENRINVAKGLLSNAGSFYLHLDYRADYLGNLLLNNTFGENNFRNKIVWAYTGVTPTKKAFRRKYDSIFFYTKDHREAIFNMQYVPYKALNATKKLSHGSEKESTPESMKQLQKRGKELEDWWDDIYTIDRVRSEMLGFQTQKPEKLLKRIISASSNRGLYILDYHLGSGTTVATAHKLSRKWLGIEMGQQIYDIAIPRMKRVLAGDRIGISKDDDINWQGGGFFKYYSLEQYEDTLGNVRYKDNQTSIFNDKNPFEEYIFFADNKLADVLEIEKNNIELNFNKLYENIDWPETISNLTGLPIKKIYEKSFTLGDSDYEREINIDFESMSNNEKLEFIQLIKPLLWWGE